MLLHQPRRPAVVRVRRAAEELGRAEVHAGGQPPAGLVVVDHHAPGQPRVDEVAKLVVIVAVKPEAADLLAVPVDDLVDHLRDRGKDVLLVAHLLGHVRPVLDEGVNAVRPHVDDQWNALLMAAVDQRAEVVLGRFPSVAGHFRGVGHEIAITAMEDGEDEVARAGLLDGGDHVGGDGLGILRRRLEFLHGVVGKRVLVPFPRTQAPRRHAPGIEQPEPGRCIPLVHAPLTLLILLFPRQARFRLGGRSCGRSRGQEDRAGQDGCE